MMIRAIMFSEIASMGRSASRLKEGIDPFLCQDNLSDVMQGFHRMFKKVKHESK